MSDDDEAAPVAHAAGLSHAEIAKLLGMTKADVIRIEARALAKLRVAAERAGVSWKWRPSEHN